MVSTRIQATLHSLGPKIFFFVGALPFGGSHLRLPSGPAGIRTTTAICRHTNWAIGSPGQTGSQDVLWAKGKTKELCRQTLVLTGALGCPTESNAGSLKFYSLQCSLVYGSGWLLVLGRPFWAKPVLRSFSGPRIGSVGASCFVDDLVSCWGKRGAYRLLLEPSWRMLKVAFYDFVVWWLDCLLLKEGASALCSLRWLLEVFLAVLRSLWVFAQAVGFHLNHCIEYFTAPCWPPCPSRLLPKFSAQKEHELSCFQSIPLLINSINLKRDGVRICLGKDVERWSIESFLTPPSFRYRVNYIG